MVRLLFVRRTAFRVFDVDVAGPMGTTWNRHPLIREAGRASIRTTRPEALREVGIVEILSGESMALPLDRLEPDLLVPDLR